MSNLNRSEYPFAILKYKCQIIKMVQENQVTLIYGHAGSGKSTKIPQYLLEAGLNKDLTIAITEPWRIAAISKAYRVSQERECTCGSEVGYEVQCDNQSERNTKIKYLTDEALVAHFSEEIFENYGVIVVDEVQERTIFTDLLLGLLKTMIKKRADLKILILLSHMEIDHLSSYFEGAPSLLIDVPISKVAVLYQPIKGNDFVTRSIEIVQKGLGEKKTGDFLIFLPSEKEINECCHRLSTVTGISVHKVSETTNFMDTVFETTTDRLVRIIVTNNIGETMFTLPSVRYVVDCGVVLETYYDETLGASERKESDISKARADMRRDRAGCQGRGWCYRIYKKEAYDNFAAQNVPNILQKNLREIYLSIVSLGLDPELFEFLDRPETNTLRKTEQELQDLGLMDASRRLTEMGSKVKDVPLDIMASMTLMSTIDLDMQEDIATMLAMMTEGNISIRKLGSRDNILAIHEVFCDENGDHFTRLNIYNEYLKKGKTKEWCDSNYMNYDALQRIGRLKKELLRIVETKNTSLGSATSRSDKEEIKSRFVGQYYRNICVRTEPGTYTRCINKRTIYMDPESSVYTKDPNIVLFHECINHGNKPTMYGIMKLDETILQRFPNEMHRIAYKFNDDLQQKPNTNTSTSQGRIQTTEVNYTDLAYESPWDFVDRYVTEMGDYSHLEMDWDDFEL